MKKVHIGLIAAGWMGRFFATGFQNVVRAYGKEIVPVLEAVSASEASGMRAQQEFGFKKRYTDWRQLVCDPDVDVVVITTPNNTHAEIAIAAAENGKHIVCEKPMAMNVCEAKKIVDAVHKAGVISLVDFTYRACPVQEQAKKMIESGQLGDIVAFKGEFDASYGADPNAPMAWRYMRDVAGRGVLGDAVTHVISISDMLLSGTCGKIDSVCAVLDTVYTQRPSPDDRSIMQPVGNEDQAMILLKYENGRIGQISSTRLAVGKPCWLAYEVQGTKGTLRFHLERMNELEYAQAGNDEEIGFKRMVGNARYGGYGNYQEYNGLGIGFSDVMGIMSYKILKAVAHKEPVDIDVDYGYYVECVTSAIEKSANEMRWVKVSDMELE
ncbi:MAG: Gfo/Idh/MocA family protein [Christensenellaceae bacterium]|jgi:predicted dehydrogenase